MHVAGTCNWLSNLCIARLQHCYKVFSTPSVHAQFAMRSWIQQAMTCYTCRSVSIGFTSIASSNGSDNRLHAQCAVMIIQILFLKITCSCVRECWLIMWTTISRWTNFLPHCNKQCNFHIVRIAIYNKYLHCSDCYL